MPGSQAAAAKAGAGGVAPSQPQFNTSGNPANAEVLRKTLPDLLEPFLDRVRRETPDTASPQWPTANGPSYREVMGQQKLGPGAQGCGGFARPGPPQGVMQGGMPGAGGWQQQGMAQMPPGGQPQMMQPGFMVANAPRGQQPQMHQQMYGGAPVDGMVPVMGGPGQQQQQQRPPNGGGGGNMPPGQQQPMAFNWQTMMVPQNANQPMGMVNAPGDQNAGGMAMGTMPGQAQMMVMYPQGFMPQQAVPGGAGTDGYGNPCQGGQQGGGGPGQHGGGMMQQPPMYQQMQMGGGGPPHQQ